MGLQLTLIFLRPKIVSGQLITKFVKVKDFHVNIVWVFGCFCLYGSDVVTPQYFHLILI